MGADLENLAFCIAMWIVPITAIALSSYLDRKASRRPSLEADQMQPADGEPVLEQGGGRVVVITAGIARGRKAQVLVEDIQDQAARWSAMRHVSV